MLRGWGLTCAVLGFALRGRARARARASGLAGRVLMAPTCPVERVPPKPGCDPRPLLAELSIRRVDAHAQAHKVRSASDGRFHVLLSAGTYMVRALPLGASPFPRPPSPRRVQVRQGAVARVTILYDTGIR